MTPLFSHPAGMSVLESLRAIFEKKPVYLRKSPFFIFVCGGRLGEAPASLRHQFIQWSEHHLPDFVCLLAEDAIKDGFVAGRRRFIDLARFESLIADIADCVLIFPESPGSFAETGFFSNSRNIRDKTLVINPIDKQGDSFLNLGPIHTIDRFSFLKPTLFVDATPPPDFTQLGSRLVDRIRVSHRDLMEYGGFATFDYRQKLSIVFEVLRLLRLADFVTLKHAISVCFQRNPQPQELSDLSRILQAAKFVHRREDSPYFRVISGPNLIEIENVDINKVLADVTLFYQKYSPNLLEALGG